MKSEAEIDALMTTAVEAGLDGLDFMARFTYAQIAPAFNGIGPASLSEQQREKLSAYLALFMPAALIHDMRYEVSDLSRHGFNYANIEFRDNCYKLANHAYGILNWRRYRAWAVAELLFAGVASDYGWQAWCDAGEGLNAGQAGLVGRAGREPPNIRRIITLTKRRHK